MVEPSTAGALPRWFRDNFAETERDMASRNGKSAYDVLDMLQRVFRGSEDPGTSILYG